MNVLNKEEIKELYEELTKEENPTLPDGEKVALFNALGDENEKKYTIEEINELYEELTKIEEKEPEIYLCRIDKIESLAFETFEKDSLGPGSTAIAPAKFVRDNFTILLYEGNNVFKEFYSGEKIRLYDYKNRDYISYVLYEYYKKYLDFKNCNIQPELEASLFIQKSALTKIEEIDLFDRDNILRNIDIEDSIIKYVNSISKSSKEKIFEYFKNSHKKISIHEYSDIYNDAYIENTIYNIKTYGKHHPIISKK